MTLMSEEDICRVCRCSSTSDQPLYYPCKCSGSIRFVHEDCLKEWLKHSKREFCELCKFRFSFNPGTHKITNYFLIIFYFISLQI